jgi:dihydrofolate reductase
VLLNRHITLVVAMDSNRVIGRAGDMPWHLSADLKHFKRTTLGHPIIMGRKTWQSIGRPLPERQNIVVTRQHEFQANGCVVVDSLSSAMEVADRQEVMVIGGGEIYRLALPHADVLELTRVRTTIADGDTWFPEIDLKQWRQVSSSTHPADEKNQFDLEFVRLERVA